MKQFFPFLWLFILCAGCAKTEFEYAVICDFPSRYADQSWLVVSNDKGDILQRFDIMPFQTHINQQFSFQAKNAEDSYNLHLVEIDSSVKMGGSRVTVQSFYGVKNGAATVFQPEGVFYSPPGVTDPDVMYHIAIAHVPGMYAWNIPGLYIPPWDTISYVNYDPSSQLMKIAATRSAKEDIIVRIRPGLLTPFYSIYLSADTLTGDTLFINWNDLLPETNLQPIAFSSNRPVSQCFVRALNLDSQHSVILGLSGNVAKPQVNFPAGMDMNYLLPVSTSQGSSEDYYERYKIFHPGEALNIEAADMDITSATLSAQGALAVQTDGAIDLLKVEFSLGEPSKATIWTIQGEPATLKNTILPDFSSFLPDWFSLSTRTTPLRVSAYQYDQLDYNQLREGLPYKGYSPGLPDVRQQSRKVFKTF